MSEIFHKSCYTSRTSGYKYRTLSTNTGEKKKRDKEEDNTFDIKFNELQEAISTMVEAELNQSKNARDSIREKYEKIDAKINSMIELQTEVAGLRDNLRRIENTLTDMAFKIEKIDALTSTSNASTLESRKSSFRSQTYTFQSDEVHNL